MSTVQRLVKMPSGHSMPTVGLGVYKVSAGDRPADVVASALALGYRHVDTAQVYGNERDVGAAVSQWASGGGDEVWVTSKLWRDAWGYEKATKAIKESLKKLQIPAIHLMLLHCPGPSETRAETWRAMEDAQSQGLLLNIGVSNFGAPHLEKLMETARVAPAVNQIELHPFLQRRELVEYCKGKGIVLEAYSPLTKGQLMDHEAITAVAKAHAVTNAQVLIRWSLQHGFVPLPKSVNPDRQRTNLDVYGFALSDAEMASLDALDKGQITGWDPITQDPV